MLIALEDLSKWYKAYPNFPNELKFENGFTYSLINSHNQLEVFPTISNKITNSEKT